MFLDDQGVPEEIDHETRAAQVEMREEVRASLRAAVTMGEILERAKRACRLGQFTVWLKRHFDGTQRKAERYLSLWREYRDPDRVPNMSLRAALDALTKRASRPRTTYAHQRPSPAVVTAGIEATRRARKPIDRLIRAMKRDRMRPQHYAMKRLRRAYVDISAAREYFIAQEVTARAAAGATGGQR